MGRKIRQKQKRVGGGKVFYYYLVGARDYWPAVGRDQTTEMEHSSSARKIKGCYRDGGTSFFGRGTVAFRGWLVSFKGIVS